MGYPLREELPGCLYHVGTRGNNRRDIYTDDASRMLFLLRLSIVVKRYEWTLVTYCLMTNHYHLVVKLSDLGLSDGMQDLNSGYARAFNIRHERRDHLFGRRFWSRQIEDETDLLTTCRYIELNPTRMTQPTQQDGWRWSSYRANVGLELPQRFHTPSEIWKLFDPQPRLAMPAWASYVEAGLDAPRPVSDTRGKPSPT
jgi:putative transposase